jgi:hypothetical protein
MRDEQTSERGAGVSSSGTDGVRVKYGVRQNE